MAPRGLLPPRVEPRGAQHVEAESPAQVGVQTAAVEVVADADLDHRIDISTTKNPVFWMVQNTGMMK